jgi:hypothetical protein
MRYLFPLLATAIALPCSATTIIDTYPFADGNVTNGWLGTAQTITIPIENILVSYRFELAARTAPGDVTFAVFDWGASGPVGPALFSTTVPWSLAGSYEVLGINLPLVTGQQYGFVVDFQGYVSQSSHFIGSDVYAGGEGWWNSGTWQELASLEQLFRAEFESARVDSVPEPTTFVLVAAGLIGFALRRRK